MLLQCFHYVFHNSDTLRIFCLCNHEIRSIGDVCRGPLICGCLLSFRLVYFRPTQTSMDVSVGCTLRGGFLDHQSGLNFSGAMFNVHNHKKEGAPTSLPMIKPIPCLGQQSDSFIGQNHCTAVLRFTMQGYLGF